MHIRPEFDDALHKWRKEVYAYKTMHDAFEWSSGITTAFRPFVIDVLEPERDEDNSRASSLCSDLPITWSEALSLANASYSDSAIRLIVVCCFAAHQPISVGVGVLKGAGV